MKVELNFATEHRINGWFVIESRLVDGVQAKGELIYGPMPEKDVRPLIEEITRTTKLAYAKTESDLRDRLKKSLGIKDFEEMMPGLKGLKRNFLLNGKHRS